jgi:hypothetical protein
MLIPPGYASVSVEKICQPDFEELELDISAGDGEKTLKDALHGIILWPKRYIVIILKNDGSPRDHLESVPLSPLPSRGLYNRLRGRHRQYLLAGLYNRLRGRHHHYLLAHFLRKNHTTIGVKRAPVIMMMRSLPIHLGNHYPQALERNLSSRCNHQRKNENDQQRKSPSQRR